MTIDIDDLSNHDVDVLIDNWEASGDLGSSDLPLPIIHENLQVSDSGNFRFGSHIPFTSEYFDGGFIGSDSELVAGSFRRGEISGAYGAKRQ